MRTMTSIYEALNAGDLTKCNDLFVRHRVDLEAYFRRRHPQFRGQTRDHVHDAFRLFVARAEKANGREFLEKDKFVPYFKTIIENLIRDLYKTLRRWPRIQSLDDTGNGALREAIHDAGAKSPLSELEQIEQVKLVKEAYLALDPGDREIITLWMLGHSYAEMAKILGRTIAAICTRKSRVMKALRRRLNEDEE